MNKYILTLPDLLKLVLIKLWLGIPIKFLKYSTYCGIQSIVYKPMKIFLMVRKVEYKVSTGDVVAPWLQTTEAEVLGSNPASLACSGKL